MEFANLPPLYAKWMKEFLPGPIPAEKRATCQDCVMCKPLEPAGASDRMFNLKTKCCTYRPILANFLVGGILQDEDPAFAEGRAQFEKTALQNVITPKGIDPGWIYWYHYADKVFGESESMRCFYYMDKDGGLCGIWRYRNSRCTTWFCKYEQGQTGFEFWKNLEKLLTATEKSLSDWCIKTLKLEPFTQAVTPGHAEWGNWYGKEREFYKECYRLVSDFTWHQVLEISPELDTGLCRQVLESFRTLSSGSVPESLKTGDFSTEPVGDDLVRFRGYNKLDPITLPQWIADVIVQFDGRPWTVVIAAIEQEQGIRMEPELVRNLYQHRILVQA
jgi:hypothetical protein